MFERYTEKARRTIFFARYEASQFGSPEIETEFLLLGLLRENAALSTRFFRTQTTAEELRREIARHHPHKEQIATSVDLPLTNESKHVLAYAAEEAARLNHHFIGTEHLLLGILREKNSFAAMLLARYGVDADAIRKDIQESQPAAHLSRPPRIPSTLGFFELTLKVADLEASVAFYVNLGFTRIGDRGPGAALLVNGSCHLTLDQNPLADHILTFRSENLGPVISRLEASGASFEQRHTAPDGKTIALVRDPTGHLISLSSIPRSTPPIPPQ